jgi:uncharacterized protein (TIGR02646 family)
MIHIDRPQQAPKALLARGKRAAEEALDFFEGMQAVSKQQVKFVDFDFDASVWQEAMPALVKVFHGKCAFCETDLSQVSFPDVEHFRPKRDALDLDGRTSPSHYYWLAYDWHNLYPTCGVCSRNKRNLFPVLGSRGSPGSTVAELERRESRLLLDPCIDSPEEHLVFDDEGRVASVTLERGRSGPGNPPFDGGDRGTITIDTFGLNRADLIAKRAEVVSEMKIALRHARENASGGRAKLQASIARLVDRARPYTMVRHQVANRWLQEMEELLPTPPETPGWPRQVRVDEPQRKRAFERLEQHEAEQATAPIQATTTYARTTRITRVRLENFRCVEELEFEVPTTGWKMLIGENGTGKSSILQAVAIALMGRQQARRLARLGDLDPEKIVRRGASSARVLVHQAAAMEPIEVRVTRQGFEYPRGRAHQKAILLGFGSARWLPRPKFIRPETDDWIRVRNLVNPFVPVCDANRWLRELGPRTNRFRAAESVVKALLRLPTTARLRVVQEELRLEYEGEPRSRALTLDQLSDGYQSALAMATGIMGPLFSKWDVMREAEGIVLVDELDAHLHPRWKMRIVEDLRRAFPNVQFVCSTHEPLCLRGLQDREILLLRKAEGALVYTDELPSPKNMRVDQLLTSRFFGLHSTLDPETERDLERYYDLLALDRHSPEQEAELRELRRRVAGDGVLGDTPRDQAIYAFVDRHIAKQLRSGAPAPGQLDPETEERLAEIWRETVASDPDVEQMMTEILET